MTLALQRRILTPQSTIGDLLIDGTHFCYILEDVVREIAGVPVSEWKIPGKTAIPRGTYRVIINMSQRFKRRMPLLLDVPGFSGIRFHAGVTAADTEGCLLTGRIAGPDKVLESRAAFDQLFLILDETLAKGQVHVKVSNPVGWTGPEELMGS